MGLIRVQRTKEAGHFIVLPISFKCVPEKTILLIMELTAALKALEWISDSGIPERNIVIYSDSLYLVETMKGNYRKKKNNDLWDQLDTLVELLFDKTIIWKHTKGHASDNSIETKGNNIVDSLAVMAYNVI